MFTRSHKIDSGLHEIYGSDGGIWRFYHSGMISTLEDEGTKSLETSVTVCWPYGIWWRTICQKVGILSNNTAKTGKLETERVYCAVRSMFLNILIHCGWEKPTRCHFCILYLSSTSCSTCFGQPCAHHQELMTAWCYILVLVCAVAAGRLSSPVGRTHYLPTGLDNLPTATAHTNTRL